MIVSETTKSQVKNILDSEASDNDKFIGIIKVLEETTLSKAPFGLDKCDSWHWRDKTEGLSFKTEIACTGEGWIKFVPDITIWKGYKMTEQEQIENNLKRG